MTGRERVLAAIEHRKTDRFPLSYEATAEVTERLIEYLGIDKTISGPSGWSASNQPSAGARKYGMLYELELQRRLGADQAIIICPTAADKTVGNWWGLPILQRLDDGRLLGALGIIFREFSYPYGSYIEIDSTSLDGERTLQELRDFPSPSLDLWDFDGLRETLCQYEGFFCWLQLDGCFDFARFARGTEQFLLDLATEPAKAEVLLDKVNDLAIAFFERCLQSAGGMFHGVYVGDDFGTQRGLLISPAMWREFIKPRYQRLVSVVKSHGIKYCHHSCGGIRPIIPDLIEIGVDVLNPIQPLAEGMNAQELSEAFGKNLTFYGGIDEQETLPKGTPETVKAEVLDRLSTLGKYGGYIVAPSHAFQPDTPVENVLAVYETVLGFRVHRTERNETDQKYPV
jgi:uroporphyrinogen decarboxylase